MHVLTSGLLTASLLLLLGATVSQVSASLFSPPSQQSFLLQAPAGQMFLLHRGSGR